MPTYNAATEAGLQAWRDSLADLLDILTGSSDISMDSLRDGYTVMLRQHPLPDGIVISDVLLGNTPAKRVAPRDRPTRRTLVYFHGGAYLFGSPEGYEALGGRLALAMDAEVLIPDYRLAPEHPYPTPIMDCVDAYEWMLSNGYDATTTCFAGDSAGGALVVSVMMHARDRGLALPMAGISISPWVDLAHVGDSMRTRAGIDPLCTQAALDVQAHAFLGGARATSPDASPIHGDLRGLPPILIQVGETEVMLSGAFDLARRLAEHRVHVTFEAAPDMFHVWHLFAAVLPEGQQALDRAASFIELTSRVVGH